jgi:hypothetical protein
MADSYEIFLYDTTATSRMILQGWEYLEFTQRVSSPWNHNIRLRTTYKTEIAQFLRSESLVDWIVLVYRTDPVTKNKQLVYEGFNRTLVDQLDSSGDIIFNFYGVGFTELLDRRITIPPVGLDVSFKSDVSETVIKSFVDEQCVNPVDPHRIIPGLTIEPDLGRGEPVSYSARNTILQTVCTRCSQDGDIDYGIVGGNPLLGGTVGTFEFQTRPLWGDNRAIWNFSGNPPTVFDVFFGNMSIPIFSTNSSEEKNVVYVGGQGQGANRLIIERELSSGTSLSPWNRREDFADARLEETEAALAVFARSLLLNKQIAYKLSFNVNQTEGTRWLENWALGDYITARYFDNEQTQKVTQVTVRVSAGGQGSGQVEFVSGEFQNIPNVWYLNIDGFTELGLTTILG